MLGHLIPLKLKSLTFAAGGNESIPLKDIGKKLFGRLVHVIAFEFAVTLTPTHTTAPTTVGVNNVVNNLVFSDGTVNRFEGGFNHMRAKERLSIGRVRTPDADTDTASATARYFRRFLTVGPDNMANPGDFSIPAGMLENGEISVKYGALTDISADCTAATCSIRVTAWCILKDELNIPPAYQFKANNATGSEATLQGRAAYETIAMLNSTSFDAISAGDFGAIGLDLGEGTVIPNIESEDIAAAYQYFHGVGEVGGLFMGEPEAASDDNHKIVNRGTPTALVGGPQDLQVVFFAGPRARLSKLLVSGSSAVLKWNGTQTTATVLSSRILAQEEAAVAAAIDKALGKMKHTGKFAPKTISKKPYTGPLVDFMPWQVKVA